MKWLTIPFHKGLDFSGRSDRVEFWMFTLLFGVINIILASIEGMLWGVPVLTFLFDMVMLLPQLALMTRRLHDMGRSGWWVLLYFTVIGAVIPFAFALAGSDAHTNQFGPPPRRGKAARKAKTPREFAEQASVFASCGACGKRMLPGAKFCANCGAPNDR